MFRVYKSLVGRFGLVRESGGLPSWSDNWVEVWEHCSHDGFVSDSEHWGEQEAEHFCQEWWYIQRFSGKGKPGALQGETKGSCGHEAKWARGLMVQAFPSCSSVQYFFLSKTLCGILASPRLTHILCPFCSVRTHRYMYSVPIKIWQFGKA